MSRLRLRLKIDAPPARVWSALCDPRQVSEWDSGVSEALDAPPDYPRRGQQVRWRLRGGLQRVLHDRPQEVVPERKLRSLLRVGLVRYDETYILEPEDGGTILRLALEVSVGIPVIGGLIVRLRAAEEARRGFENSLAALKQHCEQTS